MTVEKHSIEFYTINSNRAHMSDVRDLFLQLADSEKEHLNLLSENLRNLQDRGSWYGYVPILEG
jgi:rubrerythrin